MSERLTDEWALYEIASNIEQWELWCNIHFNYEEKKSLYEFFQIFEKHLKLLDLICDLKKKLPPHPRVNEVTLEYNKLNQEYSRLEQEIQLLAQTAILQNVLNYRFGKKSKGACKKETPKKQSKSATKKYAKKKPSFNNRNKYLVVCLAVLCLVAIAISLISAVKIDFAVDHYEVTKQRNSWWYGCRIYECEYCRGRGVAKTLTEFVYYRNLLYVRNTSVVVAVVSGVSTLGLGVFMVKNKKDS